MRLARALALVTFACAALLASPAHAVNMDWVPVGDPGNAPDIAPYCLGGAGCGSVDHTYYISTYDVTNQQYAEFLNNVDPSGTNALALYNTNMDADVDNGGINFVSGNAPGLKYVVKTTGGYGGTGFAAKPVVYVSFYDGLRFANWLNNGQGSASTETGAYTLLGGTPTPSNGLTVTRNVGAVVFLPSENFVTYCVAIGAQAATVQSSSYPVRVTASESPRVNPPRLPTAQAWTWAKVDGSKYSRTSWSNAPQAGMPPPGRVFAQRAGHAEGAGEQAGPHLRVAIHPPPWLHCGCTVFRTL